jgi:hypothetical protein
MKKIRESVKKQVDTVLCAASPILTHIVEYKTIQLKIFEWKRGATVCILIRQ